MPKTHPKSHEKKEGMKERKREYMKAAKSKKAVVKKPAPKKKGK